mgnify:CR=1 FL=1
MKDKLVYAMMVVLTVIFLGSFLSSLWTEENKSSRLDSIGKVFELKDNPYFPNLKIVSTEEVHIVLEAYPQLENGMPISRGGMVSFIIESLNPAVTSTLLTITGLDNFCSTNFTEPRPPIYKHQDGVMIEKFPANKPLGRDGHVMAYNTVSGKVILFGGYNTTTSTCLNDTWEWDGTNWTQLFPATSPPPRNLFAMVYDSARQRMVFFGGTNPNITPGTYDDTWEWDGTNWTKVISATKLEQRYEQGMAYDSFRQKVVMYGGVGSTWEANYTGLPGWQYDRLPVWEYDGLNWTPIFPATSPGSRSSAVIVYDDINQRVIMWR